MANNGKHLFSLGSILTVIISIVGSMGSGLVFLMKYEGRTTSIERDALDRERRVDQLEKNFRLIYPTIQRDETNLEWLMRRQRERDEKTRKDSADLPP